MNERVEEMWDIYTMEFYSDIKKNEIILLTGKLMEVEIILFVK
jgi:hypothetical protein